MTTSSTLTFSGNSAITGNQGNLVVGGGSLILDNSSTNISARVQSTGTVTVNGGGLFQLTGNAAGTTTNVGTLNTGSNVIGGVNVFRVVSNGASTTLNFANSSAGFTTRPGTRGVYSFESTNGNLGDVNGARITFTGSPFLGANGLLSNTANGGTVGYAIVKDAGGTDFATWNSTNGIIRATPTQTGTTAANLQSYASTDRVQFNISANQSASATITNGSLRVSPTSSGLTLAMGASNLVTNAFMLDGANDFTISSNSTATFGGTGTRYIHVNNANTTLSVNGLLVANGANPTTFAGPGYVDLTGTASQNTLTTTNRFVIAGGVVRGNNTQIGFTSAGAGIISLTGGVLEIKNGTNGTGASADFTRSLGAAAGNVTWGAGTSNEIGSGGFSAFGSAASVNIGGSASPVNLQWNTSNFIGDGYALRFGSTKSNAVLTLLNPLQFDAATSTSGYQLREVNVTAGVGGDKTVFAGAVSGSASADFVKTGTGTLELTANNTYSGNTFVRGGTLLATGQTGTNSATGTGTVTVFNTATLGGAGRVAGLVNVASGGTIRAGDATGVGTLAMNGGLTTSANATVGVRITGGSSSLTLGGSTTGTVPNPTSNNFFDITGGTLTLDANTKYFIDGTGTTFVTSSQYSYQIGRVSGQDLSALNVTNQTLFSTLGFAADTFTITGDSSGAVFLTFTVTPVPEPTTIIISSALGFALIGGIRRRIRRQSKSTCEN